MKIEYRTPPGAGLYTVLAQDGDALSASISGFKAAFTKQPQQDDMFLAAAPFTADVGNQRASLSFTVDRQHASADAAQLFILQQAALFAAVANFDLKITAGAQVLYLANTANTQMDPDPHSDLSTVIRYGFAGGTYQTAAP